MTKRKATRLKLCAILRKLHTFILGICELTIVQHQWYRIASPGVEIVQHGPVITGKDVVAWCSTSNE